MTLRGCFSLLLAATLALGSATWMAARPARQNPPNIRVSVEMVQLYVAVTDKRGKYITGLQPDDFAVSEDGIKQKMAMFAEGDNAPKKITELEGRGAKASPTATATRNLSAALGSDSAGARDRVPDGLDDDSPLAGASVFILFDTSNYMYHGFVFAQDAIADFVRSLQGPDQVALYSYSRDLFRASTLTPDRMQVLRGVRATVAGDDAALYDAILLTLRDSATVAGRRVIVVFSNGPDNASLAPPEDVEQLAQSEGVAIYMISTMQAQEDALSTKVFGRISSATGGEVYFAKNWTEEEGAFAAIRNDLAHLYTLYYYPQANPNRGWRAITVKLIGAGKGKYHVRARSGYRPLPPRTGTEATAS
ncbi:MAG TPA: VWA domain-containing protein [Candidatus Cybelea sp.]|nr:VWA domain-containing protein [Candidatus Cybelea sp.]